MENKVLCACGCGTEIIQNSKYYVSRFIHGHNNIGSNNYRWKGGRIKIGKYWYIKKRDHPFADSRGYIREHRLVYEQYYNCMLLPYVHIHHIDGNTENNSIENLQPLYHGQHSSITHKKDTSDRICLLCDSNNTKKWYCYNNLFICRNCYCKTKRNLKRNETLF